ncbi:DUF4058 family protein [Neorhodopirellula pilleata]|uniref:DUF4058 family protein n=1 Tax=Neorhodopirellula pilleata TaxID=2714738 RepID=A0A5C6AWZ3_9BACT|nr:DUF4058 family protein [Neorhodopirellula pilleata]TWU04001.1 hypothetical protein Pla100_09370 [Neorhodopirellula pilleata]
MKKSPFPGMDPFLESRWPEVHARLIVYAANQLNQRLPNVLQANIEESLAVYEQDEVRWIRPDIHVAEDISTETTEAETGTAVLSQPVVAQAIIVKQSPYKTRHIEIVDRGGRVVTAIEFVSPWNKVGTKNREQYAKKQLDYMNSKINLVEIDLVRQGKYVLGAPIEELTEAQLSAYMVCVYRFLNPNQFEVYPAPLDQALPNIPVPLRSQDRDVVLELQPLLDQCYQDGRYYRIDYTGEIKGKFNSELTDWMSRRLREILGRHS